MLEKVLVKLKKIQPQQKTRLDMVGFGWRNTQNLPQKGRSDIFFTFCILTPWCGIGFDTTAGTY